MEETLQKPVSRESMGIKVGFFSASGNLLLFICKYLAGALCGNMAVMAESLDNLMDSLNSLLVLLGFHLSGRKEDSLHPYGHGRTEYVLGFIISMTVILTGITMLRESVLWILSPPVRSSPAMVYGVSALSVAVKYGMSAYTKRVNKHLDSEALKACEQNDWADIKMTVLTAGSAVIYQAAGIRLDGWAGILISGLILKDGMKSFFSHFILLLGEGIPKQQMAAIQAIFDVKKDVITLKKADFHDYGPERRIVSMQIVANPGYGPDEVSRCLCDIGEELRKLGLTPSFSLSMDQILTG
ncbi:cation diffusion facilitator family transporter [Clostridium sp. MCC353]|uniref:cation diffusion facilitator family transporter n=1 Tax=Clostridium sp. MCC353 TaxID=2592646 RepID=UPI001C038DF6|nr:cation diffusion facilitator family transporter [Clostridium sp. MCC353]MBT9776234.1 cation diffusion facilitator family transporter [Clostridium sp. MCC353]